MLSTVGGILLMSCVAFIPDYWMNKVINEPLPPQTIVTVSPEGKTCADQEDAAGHVSKTVTITVNFHNKVPLPYVVKINDRPDHHVDPREFTGVTYVAGLGKHVIQVKVGEMTFYRSLLVFKCRADRKPHPYLSDGWFFNVPS